ncbi:MAG: IS200/IS605 family transposase [Ginsengibacter sp.]
MMANTYSQVYVQLVFAVKYRNAVIEKKWSKQLYAVMGNLINETNCKTIIVNGMADHIHCFVGLKPSVSISDLMKIVKSKSSKFINDHHLTQQRFEWQEGYGAFSYSQTQIPAVFKYIENQESHHKNRTFRDEYLDFLEKYNIDYDERYILQEPI